MEIPGSFVRPKPVFSGCDAHSFEQLESRLGKTVEQADQRNEVTWIKADPTYAGLCQTLIEPRDRTRIQSHKPDLKEPYQVIASVRFPDSADFPEEIPAQLRSDVDYREPVVRQVSLACIHLPRRRPGLYGGPTMGDR